MRKVALALLMGTSRRRPASTTLAAVAAALVGVAGCSTAGSGNATHSPTPVAKASSSASPTSSTSPSATTQTSASPSPPAVTGSYGVLAGPFVGSTYNITLVKIDGKVVGPAQTSTPQSPTCAGQAAGLVPYPISTSNDLVYFMDATGAVHTMDAGGGIQQAPVVTLPIGPSTRSVFAVSPDDSRMAVAVIDFVAGGAATRLFVDELGHPAAQNPIFSESGSYTLWPIGWHAGNLVVAKVPSCTNGIGPACCTGPQELHVVDPTTAVRRYTLGGSGCVIVGPASPAGAICENSTFTTASILNWNGTTRRSFGINGASAEYIAPTTNGGIEGFTQVATMDGADTIIVDGGHTLAQFAVCGWIDESHVLAGGDVQQQPRVGDVATGVVSPVAAQGDCAGRIPGAL
jgi:hypothetical protein